MIRLRQLPATTLFLATLLSLGGASRPTSDPLPARIRFATAVAVAGDELLIGRPGISARAVARAGGVHIFRRTTAAVGGKPWTESTVLAPADLAMGDDFGTALAVDGALLAVGAPGAAGGRGAIYIFEREARGRWRQRAKLTSATAGSRLGAVLVLHDGLLLAGAPEHAEHQGQVVVFRRGSDVRRWHQQTTLQNPASSANESHFGQALAVVGDRVLIGAPGPVELDKDAARQIGQVFVFRDSASRWVVETRLTAEDSSARTFGSALLVEGAELWVGSPSASWNRGAVFHFRRTPAGGWTKVTRITTAQTPHDGFGAALARDGQDLLVGMPGANIYSGTVSVLRYNTGAGTWREIQRLVPSHASALAQLGTVLAASGGAVLVGLPQGDGHEGAAVLFRRDTVSGQWRELTTLIDTVWTTRRAVTGGAVPCKSGKARIFDCANVDLLSFLPVAAIGGEPGKYGDLDPGSVLSSVWGWTDSATGREFAIVGRSNGAAFIEVTDPVRPKYLGSLPVHQGAKPSMWHDVKVYKHHAFIVSDLAGPHGMQVFDLTQLRNVKNMPLTFQETAHYDRVASVHTIAVNEETGYVYNTGSNQGGETCGGGLHMVDVRTPTKPTFAGCLADPKTGNGYVHETQCVVYRGPDSQYQGREICLNGAAAALGIVDVTDKRQPKTINVATYPNVGYTHQGWFTEDQRYVFVNDERDDGANDIHRTRTLIFDVSDLDDPVLLTEFYGTTAATDHNLYIRGRYMYQSNYAAGLRVIDIADPKHAKEVGHFDTTPAGENGPGYSGSWSNYPYFKSGVVAVTSMHHGLFLVRFRLPGTP